MIRRTIPPGQVWYRVADETWTDPLDPAYARDHGGRWNPPHSFPVLYVNEDVETARAQIRRLLAGSPVDPEDLDPPWVLVRATLPRGQVTCDVSTDAGLEAVGLPVTYPNDQAGKPVPWETCRPVGVRVHQAGLRGVYCRSAATNDGTGRELAWFPARSSSRARPVGPPLPFADWWNNH